ncbi:hypothetical protein PV726_32655 [Streptomyces europaeiscabiei]|uniref:hypothetical protein n=1 Tax=Streptomyces europaeiscabiei TaxID=146819 RepID=UPI0029A9C1CD|nr:hypothetical protein [Streptomyces europaeiscabiei]MDX3695008.1 hypothetical protein [Streptomyces europaeiscabiei]
MYSVEAEILTVDPSITYLPTEMTDAEWSEVCTIPQLDSEQDELQEARKVAGLARKYYTTVRIIRRGGRDRLGEVVT